MPKQSQIGIDTEVVVDIEEADIDLTRPPVMRLKAVSEGIR